MSSRAIDTQSATKATRGKRINMRTRIAIGTTRNQLGAFPNPPVRAMQLRNPATSSMAIPTMCPVWKGATSDSAVICGFPRKAATPARRAMGGTTKDISTLSTSTVALSTSTVALSTSTVALSTSTVALSTSTVALSTSTMEKECMDTGTHAMHHGIGSAFRYFDKNSIAELRPFGWRKVTKCPCPSIGINSQSTPTSFARSWNRTDVSNGTRRSFVP